MSAIRDMVEYVTLNCAHSPHAVKVSETMGEKVVMVEINVAPEDMGRIIGRHGRTIRSIRTLARVLGKKLGKRASVEIIEP